MDPLFGNPLKSQTLNRYGYVMNNPLKYVDPFGLEPVDICTDTGLCVGTIAVTAMDPRTEEALALWNRMRLYLFARDRYGDLGFELDGPIPISVEQDFYIQHLMDEVFGRGEFWAGGGGDVHLAYVLFGPQLAGEMDSIENVGLGPLEFAFGGGFLKGGVRAAGGAVVHNAQQRALIALAKESVRKGITRSEAEALLLWASEYGIKPALNHTAKPWHWVGGAHIRIGTVNHIPVR